jgi:ElaB/YqjD/DUF883 family membrane-anchored ribosome-binding protein
MSLSENKGLWFSIALLAVLAAVLVWIVLAAKPFELIVLFDDVGNLKAGDPVVWKTFKIGRVEKVTPLVDNQVGVTVRIKEDYVAGLTHGSEFILKRASFLGLVGDNAVEVVTPDSPGTPFQNGEKTPGKDPRQTSALEAGSKLAIDYLKQVSERTTSMLEDFQNSPFRNDLEDTLSQIRALAEKGGTQAKEGVEQFRKNHQKEFDQIRRKLERLRDSLRKVGDEPRARRVEEEIQRMQVPAESELHPK